jgi:hypothetical protein
MQRVLHPFQPGIGGSHDRQERFGGSRLDEVFHCLCSADKYGKQREAKNGGANFHGVGEGSSNEKEISHGRVSWQTL